MYMKLILLVVIIAVYGENELLEEPASQYAIDAEAWAELHKKYLSSAPHDALRDIMKTKCRIVKKCCPEEIDNLFVRIHENKMEETCTGARGSQTFNSKSSTCRGLAKYLYDTQHKADLITLGKVTTIPPLNARFKAWRSKMATVCSTEELTAYFCEPENMDSFRSCAEKVLRTIDRDYGESSYNTFFRQVKSDYYNLIDRVSKAFPYAS